MLLSGMSLVVFSLLLFTYYSVWVIVLVGPDSLLNNQLLLKAHISPFLSCCI
uniref:Dolichol phosphate-mannose biosynthesis regulatory protein n=1 Tax=Seriola lalandi dorsalis TaxID=1841481 RepID=A0A3B4WDK5_SERLL